MEPRSGSSHGGLFKFVPSRQFPLLGEPNPSSIPQQKEVAHCKRLSLKSLLCVKGGGSRKLHSLKSLPCVKGGGSRKLHSLKSLPCVKGGGAA